MRNSIFALLLSVLANAPLAMAQSSQPATPNPANLAEAAGAYLASVEQLNVLKTTRCGYALKRQIPSFDKVAADEVLPAFPSKERSEATPVLKSLKGDATRQGKALFDQMYTYYTQTEKLDEKTTCGFITANFITMRKLSAEAFERKARHP